MKLSNSRYEVCFETKGGEITSFLDKESGIQYMWQGDSAYWSGKNPTLFPMIGNTYSKNYEIDGKTYAMKNHGLIRYANLTLKSASENEVVMVLDSDENTLSQYPFPFHYEIAYTLDNDTLIITYHITNTGDKDMPFTFGLHPGFNCPLCEGEKFEDYKVSFNNEEKIQQIVFDTQSRWPYKIEEKNIKEWQCSYAEMEKYATIIYKGIQSPFATLSGPKGHGVELSIVGYPYFAIWTPKEGAPFVCLEPWYGHGDFSDVQVPFAQREGMMNLKANDTFTTSYRIRIF